MKSRFPFQSTKALKIAAILAVSSLPATLLLPGCGGGGSGSGTKQNFSGGGQVDLGNQQVGGLGFALFNNGTAFGTFTIASVVGTPTPAPTNVPTPTPVPAGGPYKVGSFDISGTSKGRVVTLKGTDPDLGLFAIVVTVPTIGLQGPFTAEIKGHTYTGTFAIAAPTATVAPTATLTPTSTPTVTPTP